VAKDQFYTYITQFQLISVIFRHFFAIFFSKLFNVFQRQEKVNIMKFKELETEKKLVQFLQKGMSFTPCLSKSVHIFPCFFFSFCWRIKTLGNAEENREKCRKIVKIKWICAV
jgi:hypothetical protein